MDENFLKRLNNFLGRAALATYAGNGPRADSISRPGCCDQEYSEGDWYYRDSFAGYFQSWGQEIIWCKDKLVWTQLYGGGMESDFKGDKKFTHETFEFLKKALSHGEKSKNFQPRGPKNFKMEGWLYKCKWDGDIQRFNGLEQINYGGKVVFKHIFFGGVFMGK